MYHSLEEMQTDLLSTEDHIGEYVISAEDMFQMSELQVSAVEAFISAENMIYYVSTSLSNSEVSEESNIFSDMWEFIKRITRTIVEAIGNFFTAIGKWIKNLFSSKETKSLDDKIDRLAEADDDEIEEAHRILRIDTDNTKEIDKAEDELSILDNDNFIEVIVGNDDHNGKTFAEELQESTSKFTNAVKRSKSKTIDDPKVKEELTALHEVAKTHNRKSKRDKVKQKADVVGEVLSNPDNLKKRSIKNINKNRKNLPAVIQDKKKTIKQYETYGDNIQTSFKLVNKLIAELSKDLAGSSKMASTRIIVGTINEILAIANRYSSIIVKIGRKQIQQYISDREYITKMDGVLIMAAKVNGVSASMDVPKGNNNHEKNKNKRKRNR